MTLLGIPHGGCNTASCKECFPNGKPRERTRIPQAIVIDYWDDDAVSDIRDDCMMLVSDGVHYHARLNLYIIVQPELTRPPL
jgi:hypothetical protein